MKLRTLPASPASLRDPLLMRVLHAAYAIGLTTIVLLTWAYSHRGETTVMLIEGVTGLFLALAYSVAVRWRLPMLGLKALGLAGWLMLALISWLQGGLYAPALAWIILATPLMLLLSKRLALVLVVGTVLLIFALYAADVSGHLPAAVMPSALQRAVSTSLATVFLTVIAWYMLRLRERLAQELEAARAATIEANHAKDRFIANLHHEIRTPLNALVAGARLLNRQDMSATQRSVAQALEGSAKHLHDWIESVLEHNHLEAGTLKIEPQAFSLRELLQATAAMFAPLAAERQVVLQCQWPDDLHDTRLGDPLRLRQVLSTLVSNAIGRTPAGGSVWLRAEYAPDPARRAGESALVHLCVQDTGTPPSTATPPAQANPFSPAPPALLSHAPGDSPGLSICHELLRLMSGTLEQGPEPGPGTHLRARLPLPLASPPRAPESRSAEHAVRVSLLLVEDDPLNRLVMQAVLSEIGAQVTTADSGAQALEHLQAQAFDLVLMDCQMTEMDGLSATRQWRAMEAAQQRPRLPIIALTGDAYPQARAACLSAGMDDYLTKPASTQDLRRVLARYAGARSPHAASNVT